MRNCQFKSLTLRIWLIVSAIIFTIVLVTSIVFTFLFKDFNEHKAREILHYTHEFVLYSISENQINKEMKEFVNHDGMRHFIFDKETKKMTFIPVNGKEIDQSLLIALNNFLETNQYSADKTSYKKTINNHAYLFQISHMKNQLFLISYRRLSNEEHLLFILGISVLIILFSLPIAKVVAKNIAKPLKQLEAYTRQIANKEWHSELRLNRQDEIGSLAAAMNDMKQALKQADEEENKFLQSISHDLKTPVMVIMSYAQAIIDGMYVDSADNTAMIIKNEAIRLERKIKQILYLNTLDYVLENEKEQEEVYLDKLLTYLLQNFQAINPEITWQLTIKTKAALVNSNPDRIRVSIENILENQLRYAAKSILVLLYEDDSSWVIEIKNDGPLIPEKDLNQIFKSLYKGDRGNFGLGLTISQKIINFYHGNIQVENKGQQVCFTVYYPKK